jgi:hypothetical protein
LGTKKGETHYVLNILRELPKVSFAAPDPEKGLWRDEAWRFGRALGHYAIFSIYAAGQQVDPPGRLARQLPPPAES